MPIIDAKPFHYEFGFDHVALVCIDMQRDFCQPGGFAESLGNDISNLQFDEEGTYPAGSFVVNPPGTRHSPGSREGCVALLICEKGVRFVETGQT